MFAMPAGASLPLEDPQYQPPLPKDPIPKNTLPEELLSPEPGRGAIPDVDPDSMEGEQYNMCHFWSNFEIARLDWFRSKEYNEFFEMMDRSGGFWMERVRLRPDTKAVAVLTIISGVTLPYIPSPPAPCSLRKTFTTSEISDTVILRYSIAQLMLLATGNCHDLHFSR